MEPFLYREEKTQEFRDADADGAVGMRGYLEYFQDAAATYMHRFDWDNSTVHERFGVAWVYTKYRMQCFEKTFYDHPLHMECWIEPSRPSIAVRHALEITKCGQLMARGRLESCIVDLEKKRISRLSAIGYDGSLALERENPTPEYTHIEQSAEGMEEIYSHRVRYTDLDNNAHMNNLRYIPLLLDAYEPEFHEAHRLTDLEIHYRNQCLYGEKLSILKCSEGVLTDRLQIRKEDGSPAVCARLIFSGS
ncbi:MAG: hypothetical protein IK115_04845 [Lachnospiraceae bacterium]|nr:hypothetical protein [Lachnospiraceae bacterium]